MFNNFTKFKKKENYNIYSIYLEVNKNNNLIFKKSFNYFTKYKKGYYLY